MTDELREAVAKAKLRWNWPSLADTDIDEMLPDHICEAKAIVDAMQPEIDRRVAEERAKLLERFDEDALEEIISDSLEMDWRPRDAARAIIAQFEKENSDG